MTYSEKLKDPRWQRRRLEILERDGWKCRQCESEDRTLHVHHCYYIKGREPWEYAEELLFSLCENCHTYTEKINKLLCKYNSESVFQIVAIETCSLHLTAKSIGMEKEIMGDLLSVLEYANKEPENIRVLASIVCPSTDTN